MGVIIVATISCVTCNTASAVGPYIMGAFIGAGMELFMQTVIQGTKIEDVNWLRVGIAAVSGVISAIPGVGWFGAGLIQGTTEAALTAVDGGSLEDVLKAFTVGFVTGVVIHGVGKAISKMKLCFVAGTAVLMAGGSAKAIEKIRVGDLVKSYNPVTGEVENKRVLQTFENETSELVTVSTSDGQKVISTPGHKFFANNEWIAEDLKAGDNLVTVNGEKVIVERIQHEILESPVKVYNFEVSDNHTYFVGDGNGLAVHNSACRRAAKAKKTQKIFDVADDFEGVYEFKLRLADGTEAWYVGKATGNRPNVSLSAKLKDNPGSVVLKTKLHKCPNVNNNAFKLEAKLMNKHAGKQHLLLNKISSPGFKYGNIAKDKNLKKALYRNWFGKK